MTNDTNPATALRAAMRDLLSMFTETLGDEAGAAALKTAVERALSDVAGTSTKPRGKASKSPRGSTAKSAAPSAGPAGSSASKGGKKKKAKAGPTSPGRQRQREAMKEYWRKRRAEAEALKKSGGGAIA